MCGKIEIRFKSEIDDILTNVEYNKAFGSNKDYITIQANWPSFGVDSLRIKKVLLKN